MAQTHLKAYCTACGHELPLWFTPGMTDGEDDAAYEQWLDTPCPSCSACPRQSLPKKHETIH